VPPPQKIILIRHAEKPLQPPPYGVDENGVESKHCLTPRGWERAGALVAFFRHPTVAGIATPNALYASGGRTSLVGDDGADIGRSLRPQQTLTPLSRKLSLSINTSYDVGEEQALANEILELEGVVLVAWVHKYLPVLARLLKADAPEHWPARYDPVWILDFDGKRYELTQTFQSLLDGDVEAVALSNGR
jgi:hypothetical protein